MSSVNFTSTKKQKWGKKSWGPVNFTPSDLGDASCFKPDSYRGPIFVWTRPTPGQQNSWTEKFPEQTGSNKDGKVVPLRDFDIYDMLSGFMSSKEISLLMEKEEEKRKK